MVLHWSLVIGAWSFAFRPLHFVKNRQHRPIRFARSREKLFSGSLRPLACSPLNLLFPAVFRRLFALWVLFVIAVAARATPAVIMIVAGDMHSAYEHMAQFLARVDRVRAENPGVPVAVLIDGDTFEAGNAVARRSNAAVELALLKALADRGPTVLNLGNHETDFFAMGDAVARIQATGVKVIGGNTRDHATGEPFAPAYTELKFGVLGAVIAGVNTDRLSTFRAAVRPSLDLADPVAWATDHFPKILATQPLTIVLSHAGLKADRALLDLVPDGTLFAGAHDHLRFVHRQGGTTYFHSGSWTEYLSIARLEAFAWQVEQVRIDAGDPADPALAALIRDTMKKYLTPQETAVVGHTREALGPTDAARLAVDAARKAAGADAAMIGGTTFGAGLPAGDVSQFALDACVRFDGPLFMAEVDGAWLKKLLAKCNQGPDTPWAERAGENLVAVAPDSIEAGRKYKFVTSDWVAHNAKNYFGDDAPVLTEHPELKLKAAVIAALAPAK